MSSLLKGRPDTDRESPKYLAGMVEVLAHLTDVHEFLRERRARIEQFRPAPTAWRKIEDDPDAPWNRETDAERKRRVVRETLGYDPDARGHHGKRTLTPASAEDVANLRLKTPAAPPSPQLIAKLEAEGYPFVPKPQDQA
jgi:hypothetical protein